MFGKTKLRCFLESAFAPLRRFLEASEVLLLENSAAHCRAKADEIFAPPFDALVEVNSKLQHADR